MSQNDPTFDELLGKDASNKTHMAHLDPWPMKTGALISVCSCAIILTCYSRRRRWKRHPNAILFWKSAIDFLYAIRFLVNWDGWFGTTSSGCRALASLTQFLCFASECWFVSMSFDLYQSSTNPFTNIRQNVQMYHAFAWCVGLVSALVLWCANLTFDGVHVHGKVPECYVNEKHPLYLLLYYVVVVLFVFLAVVFTFLENYSHPYCGMKEALSAKKHVIRSARIFTLAYIVYQVLLVGLWTSDLLFLRYQSVHVQMMRNVTSFFQTARGFLDLVIWLAVNGFPWRKLFGLSKRKRSSTLNSAVDEHDLEQGKSDGDRTCSSSHSSSSSEFDEYSDIDLDLQPQLNAALRKEVLHFATRGIVAASTNANKINPQRRVVHLRLHELGMCVRFDDYNPVAFRDIRRGFGIKEPVYRKSFLATCHERIQSGGSSGAFMFYTADYTFIVKTVTTSERTVLLRMLPAYVAHMKANPESHLTRYYGCHSIEMYGQTFSFVVMGNVIGRVSMHQFYDIKASWIDRNAKPIPPGKTVICTYCSNAFKYGSTENCPHSIHGQHLPHVVLKDNDFHRKLRLDPEVAQKIVGQLEKDTNFLCSQGIMDYSLLISVHSTKYVVDNDSWDVTHAINTKRRVNYAVCRPSMSDSFISDTASSLSHPEEEEQEEEDLSGEEGSEEDDTVEEEQKLLEMDRRVDRQFSRTCRFSVLGSLGDDASHANHGTPLLTRQSAKLKYEATLLQAPSSTHSSEGYINSRWVGSRSIDKQGYRACMVVGPDYYTMGIIDMLQTWTLRKRLERLWKVWVLRNDPKGLSAAPPKYYTERFQRKMHEIMMVSSSQIGFGHH